MHNIVQEIAAPVAEEMLTFKEMFRENLMSPEELLKDVTKYLSEGEGKQLRPLVVLLSAKIHGEVCKSTYIAATAIEMVHTATLIHDDVVDNSNERRGLPTVHIEWGPQVAVLVGDYLLSKALHLTTINSEFELLKLVTQAVQQMSEGELVQLAKAETLNTTEEEYLNIIYKKTASFLAACTSTGTRSVGMDDTHVALMTEVGKNIGMAFQIRDDIFDYEINNLAGKPVGNDIKEHKLTLPLIAALRQTDDKTKQRILKLLANHSNENSTVEEIIKFVRHNGGIEYSVNRMQQYCEKAVEILSQYPESPARRALIQMAYYTGTRKS
ncbi:MAG: polyprenyl synthetase family protein [Prevotellaceae bacterium]|jgi:octaprenyl-diphosphate synthase|nr:polyprenyl synthetase family protein [Prevotellaceae bacterium]